MRAERRPTVAELTHGVRRLLERSEPPSPYERRVAANVLGILERELAQGAGAAQAAQRRRADFFGRDGISHEALCEQIAAGALDAQWPALLALLKADTLARLAIDNPRYPAYRRAVATSEHPPEKSP